MDSSLFFKLVRVVNLTARPFIETLSHAHELSLNEWRTMVVLASHPGATARTVSDLTGLDKMSISRAVASLDRRARIQRTGDPQDARRTQLRLSPSGEQLFRSIGVLAAERESLLLAGIDATERLRFEQMVDRMIRTLALVDDAASMPQASEGSSGPP
jgi:DNA-binding MarR family transcriptional regulator